MRWILGVFWVQNAFYEYVVKNVLYLQTRFLTKYWTPSEWRPEKNGQMEIRFFFPNNQKYGAPRCEWLSVGTPPGCKREQQIPDLQQHS